MMPLATRMIWAVPQIDQRDGKILSHRALFSPSTAAHSSSPYSHSTNFQRDSLPLQSSQVPPPPPPPPSPSSNSKISPAVLFIIVILAVIFFISGLLHLLVRFLVKQHPSPPQSSGSGRHRREIPGSDALQRQLQQLFHLHDSGLDQAVIDALPVFLYKEIVGQKEPFDCAVCLCEFAEDDKLRLLPICSHAFHVNCIDTWLLSNSTCPLCRGALFVPGVPIENPVFDFEDLGDEERLPGDCEDGFSLPGPKPVELEEGAATEKRVFHVRLGKFRSLSSDDNAGGPVEGEGIAPTNDVRREEGESSSSSLDARRCYSMGSYQYIVRSNLQVSLSSGKRRDGTEPRDMRRREFSVPSAGAVDETANGKRLWAGSKGESFSVSKIWQWSNKKGKFPVPSDAASLDGGLPWIQRTGGDT